MFLRRDRRGPDRHVELRARLLGLGALVALAGIALDRGWLVNVAIGILVLGFGLRFVGREGRMPDDGERHGEDGGERGYPDRENDREEDREG